jgi:hypothetical protein
MAEEHSEGVDVDATVDRYINEIVELLEEFPEEDDEHVDTALFTCVVERAIDAGITKEELLEMLDGMYEESKEMTNLQDRMSLTRGEA